MKTILTTLAILGSLGAGWLVYQTTANQSQPAVGSAEQEPLAVELVPVTRRDIRQRVELVGSLEPRADVTIRSRVRGYITSLPFDIGDRIEPDERGELPLIVALEDSTPREMLRGAEAALEVARAQLAAKKSELKFAHTTARRQAELAETGATSQQEIDQAQSQLVVAEAEVQLEEARVKQALSEVERNRLAVRQTEMRAALTGSVAERLVEVGDLANPDDPLLRIVDISKVRIVVSVVERDYQQVGVGQIAEVRLDAFPNRVFQGRVARKSPVLDLETRTAAVQVEIENSERLLKPGMHARVEIVSGIRSQVAAVPAASLLNEPGRSDKASLFVVEGSPPRARRLEVQTGLEDEGYVEIRAGLSHHDHVVALGTNLLEDGQTVMPLEPPSSAPTASANTVPEAAGEPMSTTAAQPEAVPAAPERLTPAAPPDHGVPHNDGVPHVGG